MNKKQFEKQQQEIESEIKKDSNSKIVIIDGVVNYEKYFNQSLKILWVLKEVNSPDENESWDMREAIGKMSILGIGRGWHNTFDNIAYITHGILNNLNWDDMPFVTDKSKGLEVCESLSKISYINIKKTPGGSVSSYNEIMKTCQQNQEILSRQIDLYAPDVIICGGTYDCVELLTLEANDKVVSEKPLLSMQFKNTLVVDAKHPSARVKSQKYCDEIISTVLQWHL